MADPNVKIIFTANSAQAEAAMARIERRLRKIEALTKRGGKGPAAGIASGFNAAATAVGRFALSLAGLGSPLQAAFTIINQIRIAIDGLRAAQEDAARTNITFEQALSQSFRNLDVGDPDIPNIENLQKVIDGISRRTGVDPTGVALALSSGFSARGDLSALDVTKAIEKTLNLVRDLPDDQRAFIAGSVLDIRKLNPNITEEGALGFISAAQTKSRVTDIGIFSKNVIGPIVASAIGERNPSGEDLRFTAALSTTISQFMVDLRGRRAGTAQIQIIRRIKELIRATPVEDLPPEFEDNLLGRLRAVQQDPELRAKIGTQIENAIGEMTAGGFLLKGRFSVKSRDVLEGLLTGEGRVSEAFDKAIAFIPNPESKAAIRREAELRKNLQRSQPALVGQTEREFKAATQRERLRRLQPALAGAIRPGLREFLESQGVLQQLIDLKIFEFDIKTGVGTVDSLQAVIRILRKRDRFLVPPQRLNRNKLEVDKSGNFGVQTFGPEGTTRAQQPRPSAENIAQAKAAQEVADRLQKLVELQEENNRLQQQNVDQNQPRINRNGQMEPAGVR